MPKRTLSEVLQRLASDMGADENFVPPDEWEIGEVCHLLREASNKLKEVENEGT